MSGGSVGVAEADVIVEALRHSGREGIPLVAFIESAGARLQEGAGALGGFGRIFSANVALAQRVPQISVITGTSAGGGCYSPALTDFVVMTEQATMFLTGPKIVRQALGEEVSAPDLGGTGVHERNGVCHLVSADDLEAVALCRELLSYLPQTAGDAPPVRRPEPAPLDDPGMELPSSSRSYYDVRAVIRGLVDRGGFLELWPRWARNMVVGFARLDGRTVGIVANQSRHLGGIIDTEASQKAARFIRTAERFRIPLLVLVDTPGFMPGSRQESAGVIRHGAELLRAFAGATVPRVTVIVRKAYGGAFITMNCKDLGARAAFAWHDAEIGIMSPRSAVEIIHRRELEHPAGEETAERLALLYAQAQLSATAALRRGAIDDVIAPHETRTRVIEVLFGRRRFPRRVGGTPAPAPAAGLPEPPELRDAAGCTLWFTGLSGAGKSTVAALVARELRERGERVEVLDGDVVRQHLSKGLGFSREDRDTNIRRIAFVADVLSRNGVCVLVAAISPYRVTRDEARELMGERFIEIYLRTSLDECIRRDTKGLYERALRGEIGQFTGISDPYEEPLAPEIALDTEREAPEESAARVLALVAARLGRAEVAA
ncbi:adenylyl-sulfate kinase [Baekduia soli]|uniref:Adenylyl-sulfate kinase n=1 Tax=Baekduia soli TaxID=496014 RepID=A0A5B8U608_9ACTN|nr:adenylyl-sulfate kinase [Baekduia soli]QEC48325.1 adenylyl-sulfate kinase [Baekduia soli]